MKRLIIDRFKENGSSICIHKFIGYAQRSTLVEVIIAIPRGGFLKRGSKGELDFISPFPCPFNYGSIPALIRLDGDLLDAGVLGPRPPMDTTVKVNAWGRLE